MRDESLCVCVRMHVRVCLHVCVCVCERNDACVCLCASCAGACVLGGGSHMDGRYLSRKRECSAKPDEMKEEQTDLHSPSATSY